MTSQELAGKAILSTALMPSSGEYSIALADDVLISIAKMFMVTYSL